MGSSEKRRATLGSAQEKTGREVGDLSPLSSLPSFFSLMPDFSFTRQKLNAWNTGYLMLNVRPFFTFSRSDLPLNLAQGLCLVSVKVRLETTLF